MKFPSIDDFNNVLSDINKYIHKTPIVSSSSLNKIYNSNIFFKLELFQKTGSFKTRGAINKLLKLSDLEKDKGVITISAGNHAQAISWACSQFNIKSKIVMPFDASQSKVEATKSYGGEVILTKNNMMDECNNIKEKEGLTFVHPFDDIDIILGQGTIGVEIIEKLNNIDYAFISIGGGGLISGIACVLKSINPKIKIIGVEPINSNVMTKSILSNKPETFDTNINKTIADGLAAPFAGNLTFEFVKKYVDEIICYQKALDINPDDLQFLDNMGTALCTLGDYKNAITYFDRSISIDPNQCHPWQMKAMALKELGLSDEAEDCYHMAKKLGA